MDEQNFKFNYVFQGQDCTLSTGVYKITIQNHVYIGSAAISFRKRWRQHQLDFIRDIHHSRFAQNAFNKYGIATFEIMELCPRELCIEREQWWIDTLKPDLNILKMKIFFTIYKCGEIILWIMNLQTSQNMSWKNSFLGELLKYYSGDNIEKYENLCDAVSGFIRPCHIEDFNPYTFMYDDVENEILWILQSILESDYTMVKALSIEPFLEILDVRYLDFDELEVNNEDETFFLLQKFVDKINETITLKLRID